jgi:hypothetical protein
MDRRMKRFVIFALLGPPLGMITGLWVMLPLLNLAIGARPLFEPSTLDWHEVVLLPFAYLMELNSALAHMSAPEVNAMTPPKTNHRSQERHHQHEDAELCRESLS